MSSWDSVVFRPYDKGNGLFILDKEDYKERVEVHLKNTSTFNVVEDRARELDIIKKKITDWTITYKNEVGMTKKIVDWVIPADNCKAGANYVNPKRHKPAPYSGRLISTGCGTHIENLSALTGWQLKQCKLDYCLIDSDHFLSKVQEINSSGMLDDTVIIHVSFDIVEMFPSICKEFGMEQCRSHLDALDNKLFSTDCILDGLEITLDHNITEFDDVTYKQGKGAATGPKNSCSYTDNALDFLDQKVHSDTEGPPRKPPAWCRFRDDIYCPWPYSLAELITFFHWLNTLHPDIKFTMNHSIPNNTTCIHNCPAKSHSVGGVEYLEMFVYDKGHKLHTRPWSKPSDTHIHLYDTHSGLWVV